MAKAKAKGDVYVSSADETVEKRDLVQIRKGNRVHIYRAAGRQLVDVVDEEVDGIQDLTLPPAVPDAPKVARKAKK